MPDNETLSDKTIRMVMTANLEQLSDANFVRKELIRGTRESDQGNALQQALEVKKLLEDMRVSAWTIVNARKVDQRAWVATGIALFSLLVSLWSILRN